MLDEGRFLLLSEKSPPLIDRIGLNAAEASSNRNGRMTTDRSEIVRRKEEEEEEGNLLVYRSTCPPIGRIDLNLSEAPFNRRIHC